MRFETALMHVSNLLMCTALAYISLLFLTAIKLDAQSVAVHNGNVEFLDRQGLTHRVSDSGLDSEPSLSKDGGKIVFVRTIQKDLRTAKSQLWIAETAFASPKRVYAKSIALPDGRTSDIFFSPAFSAGGESIYFLTTFAATSHALCRLDLKIGQVRFLSPAMDYRFIRDESTRVALIVSVRTLSEPDDNGLQFPIYPFFLLDSEGAVLARLPCSETDSIEMCAIKSAGGATSHVR